MSAVATEYMHELEQMRRSPAMRIAERVDHLLADDGLASFDDLGYEPEAWHLGMIVKGAKADETLRVLASRLDRRGLCVPRQDGTVWAWLGGRRPVAFARVQTITAEIPADVSVAVGESRWGADGWRLTHREAQAALLVLLRRQEKMTRGRDTVLLAAVLRDKSAAESLREEYLRPLEELGSFEEKLCRTLQVYVATKFNAESTRVILDIDRSTVERHVRKAEELFDRQIHSCHAELKVALELRELVDHPDG